MEDQTTPEISYEEAVKLADFDSLSALVGSLSNPAEAVYTALLLAREHPEEAEFVLKTMKDEFLRTIANDEAELEKTHAEQREFVNRWVEYNKEVHEAPMAGAQRRKRAVDNANKRTAFLKAMRNAKSPEEAIEAAKAAGIPVEFVNGDPDGDHTGHDHAIGMARPNPDLLN